jgi:cytochrome P450
MLRSAFQVNQLIITAPNSIAEVLVQHPYDFEKAQGVRECLRNVLGDGLVLTEGDVHRFQRRHLIQPFNFRNIKNLYPVMWAKSWRMIDHIEKQLGEIAIVEREKPAADQKPGRLEFNNWASRATLDIIGIAALGKDFNCLVNTDFQLVRDYEELLAPDGWRIAFFVISAFFGWHFANKLPWKTRHDFLRLAKSLRSTGAQLIQDKRHAMAKGGEHKDILGLLIDSNDFSDVELLDHVLTFLAAG